MWFKNLRIYRLTQPFAMSLDALAEALQAHAFTPCGAQDSARIGWVPPLGRDGKSLLHATNGYWMLCAKRQEKILPGGVVREHLEEKVAQIQQSEARSVGRAEKQNLKEEIVFSLMPRALTRSQLQYAYIDPQDGWIVIDTASAKRAEDLLSLLRDATGSLPVVPLRTRSTAAQIMTDWLKTGAGSDHFHLGGECELEAPKEEGRVVRCKKQDLTADEMRNHLNTGMVVRKLEVHWQDALECVLDHELAVKRLKFTEKITDQADERNPETAAEAFDTEFAIMTLELKPFIQSLLAAFGGLDSRALAATDQA